jgi:hypothetical protein
VCAASFVLHRRQRYMSRPQTPPRRLPLLGRIRACVGLHQKTSEETGSENSVKQCHYSGRRSVLRVVHAAGMVPRPRPADPLARA